MTPERPRRYSCRREPDDSSGAFKVRIKHRVTQEPSDKSCHLVLSDYCDDDGIMPMAQRRRVETKVTGEKRGLAQAPQQDDDLFVCQPFAAHIEADLSNGDAPPLEQQALPLEDVLI